MCFLDCHLKAAVVTIAGYCRISTVWLKIPASPYF
jgi:hypothetical protein